jgi:hypothetical protein
MAQDATAISHEVRIAEAPFAPLRTDVGALVESQIRRGAESSIRGNSSADAELQD